MSIIMDCKKSEKCGFVKQEVAHRWVCKCEYFIIEVMEQYVKHYTSLEPVSYSGSEHYGLIDFGTFSTLITKDGKKICNLEPLGKREGDTKKDVRLEMAKKRLITKKSETSRK